MKRSLVLAPAILLLCMLAGCGSRLPAPPPEKPVGCTAKVEENAFIPNTLPAKVVKEEKPGGNRCFTEAGLKERALELACQQGFPLVSLVNIQKPGFWTSGPCYRADLEFYSTAEGMQISGKPLVRYDTIAPTGVQLLIRFTPGAVLDGPQDESGLVSDKGDTATTSKVGFYLGLRYFPVSFLGIEAETGGMWGTANAPDTKGMDFTKAWVSNLGLSLIPWQRMTLMGRIQVGVSGGLNYTRLALSDEFKEFVESNSGIVFNNDAATGFGWYSGLDFRVINKHNLLGEIGLRYMEENPQFPKGTVPFEANSLLFDLAIGYRF